MNLNFLFLHYSILGNDISQVQSVARGNLSENWIFESGSQKFFLKKYRFDNSKRIEEIHSVKHFFAERGVPVILPFTTKEGKSFFEEQGSFYALFPFINGKEIEWEDLSSDALASAGGWLAHIHLQTKDNCPTLVQKRSFGWNRESFLQKANAILEKIQQEEIESEFSGKAKQLLEAKKELVAKNSTVFEDFQFGGDHVIHGDYHEENLFFAEDDQVLYVFDWEKCNIAPRVIEIARAVEFFGFYGVYTEETFERAKVFLQAYQNLYPIDQDELAQGLKAWYIHQLHNTWVLEEHYLKGNNRVDMFLENQVNAFEYHSEYIEEYIQKLQSFLG